MTSHRAALIIIGWLTMLAAAILLSATSLFAAGVAVGSVVTAGALLLVVKWSIEGMLSSTATNIESMQDALEEQI